MRKVFHFNKHLWRYVRLTILRRPLQHVFETSDLYDLLLNIVPGSKVADLVVIF